MWPNLAQVPHLGRPPSHLSFLFRQMAQATRLGFGNSDLSLFEGWLLSIVTVCVPGVGKDGCLARSLKKSSWTGWVDDMLAWESSQVDCPVCQDEKDSWVSTLNFHTE